MGADKIQLDRNDACARKHAVAGRGAPMARTSIQLHRKALQFSKNHAEPPRVKIIFDETK
jgi:hypothetical protein